MNKTEKDLLPPIEKWDELSNYLPSMNLARRVSSVFAEMFREYNNYIQFLKQTPKLGDFVACDEEGNVLSEPKDYKFYLKGKFNRNENINWQYKCRDFKAAQERVKFVGFEVETLDGYGVCRIINKDVCRSKFSSGFIVDFVDGGSVYKNLADLTGHGLKYYERWKK